MSDHFVVALMEDLRILTEKYRLDVEGFWREAARQRPDSLIEEMVGQEIALRNLRRNEGLVDTTFEE